MTSKEKLDSKRLISWLEVNTSNRIIGLCPWASLVLISLSVALFVNNHHPLWVIAYGMYLALYFFQIAALRPILDTAQFLDDELGVFKRILFFLERHPFDGYPRVETLCAVFQTKAHRPSSRIRLLKIATMLIGIRNNPITGLFLNLLFPWDFFCATWMLYQRKQLRTDFPQWLDRLSELEVLLSMANFAYINPDYCFPQFTQPYKNDRSVIKVKQLGHPLIEPERKVTNDFEIKRIGELSIITGSNMAGKSTFLKTLGINMVLANVGCPVNAVSFTTSFFRICTCIKVGDSLADGFSSFYAEVLRLCDILSQSRNSNVTPVLYLIDEVLRGTNNHERILGSRSLARALIATLSVGLICTHDLEITHLADEHDQIINYHFAETISEDKMEFSYKLEKGPCPTTNALIIMRNEGLPV